MNTPLQAAQAVNSDMPGSADTVPLDVLQAQLESMLNQAAPDFAEMEALAADISARERALREQYEAALAALREQTAERYQRLEMLKQVCELHKQQAASLALGLWEGLGRPAKGGKTHGAHGEVVVKEQRVVDGFDAAAAMEWVIDPQNGALNFAPRALDEKRLKKAMIKKAILCPAQLGTVTVQVGVDIHVPKLLKRLV